MSGLFLTALLAVVALELVLSAGWNRFYYRRGLPIFRRWVPRIDVARISSRWLVQQHRHTAPIPLTFKRLSDHEIAFREGIGVLHYTPVMHGVLRNHRSGSGATVVGYLHWSTGFFLAGMLVRDGLNVLQGRIELPLSLLFLLITAMLYGFQAARLYRFGTMVGSHISHVSKQSLKAQYEESFPQHAGAGQSDESAGNDLPADGRSKASRASPTNGDPLRSHPA